MLLVVLLYVCSVVSIIAKPVSITRGAVTGSRKRRIALVWRFVCDLLWKLALPLFMSTVYACVAVACVELQ